MLTLCFQEFVVGIMLDFRLPYSKYENKIFTTRTSKH